MRTIVLIALLAVVISLGLIQSQNSLRGQSQSRLAGQMDSDALVNKMVAAGLKKIEVSSNVNMQTVPFTGSALEQHVAKTIQVAQRERFVRKPHDIANFEATKVEAKPSKDDKDALDYKIHLYYGDKRISPWHDIPYAAKDENSNTRDHTTLLHFVCEIPKGTARKYETITTKEVLGVEGSVEDNPIMQDRKNKKGIHRTGKVQLREYRYPEDKPATWWNYGAVPQTWEEPHYITPETGAPGDDDPIDVVQLNDKPCAIGDVQVVRPLGIFALIDEGETDWKMLVVDVNAGDTKSKWKTLKDVPQDTQAALLEWFRMYKVPEGKGENEIPKIKGDSGSPWIKDEKFAARVAFETHEEWCKLTKVDGDYCRAFSSAEHAKVFPLLTLFISSLLVSV